MVCENLFLCRSGSNSRHPSRPKLSEPVVPSQANTNTQSHKRAILGAVSFSFTWPAGTKQISAPPPALRGHCLRQKHFCPPPLSPDDDDRERLQRSVCMVLSRVRAYISPLSAPHPSNSISSAPLVSTLR